MISEMIEEDARRLDEIIADLNREANKHRTARDDYNRQAQVLADKRDKLQAQARRLSSQAAVYKQQRDECNICARENKQKRDEWNDRAARMRAAGGLGDIGEEPTVVFISSSSATGNYKRLVQTFVSQALSALRSCAAGHAGRCPVETKSQAQSYHQKVVKYSQDGQALHDKMHSLMEQADRLRQEAQTCHEQCQTCRRAANSEHEKYIAAVRKIERVRDNLPE